MAQNNITFLLPILLNCKHILKRKTKEFKYNYMQ